MEPDLDQDEIMLQDDNSSPQRKKKMTLYPAAGHAGDGLPSRKLFSQNNSPVRPSSYNLNASNRGPYISHPKNQFGG
jgi:hypothetical protein